MKKTGWWSALRIFGRTVFTNAPNVTTRQFARIVRDFVTLIGVAAIAHGTHSMRGPKVPQICKNTGNPRAVHPLLGQTKMDGIVRCLGSELEDAPAIAETIEI